MRVILQLSANRETIPYPYQQLLSGTVNKWLGYNNKEHGKTSLYSFSWLHNTISNSKGINLTRQSYFFISAYDDYLIKRIIKGVLNDPSTFYGSNVTDIQIIDTPLFGVQERFMLSSPILLKKKEGLKIKHLTYLDDEFNSRLTKNLQQKLKKNSLPDDNVAVEWDRKYPNPKIKLVDYKGIKNKTTMVPIIIKGTPEQIAFAWSVSLGNSTGIGFGSLK